MSTQMTAITTQPTATTGLNQDQKLGLEVLFLIESKNNQVLAEVIKSQETTNELLANLRKNLEAVVLENGLLKNRIIQQETINSENTRLHTEEMKANTQIITELSQSINPLTDDLRLANNKITTLENQMKILTTPPPQPVAPTQQQIWEAIGIKNIFG